MCNFDSLDIKIKGGKYGGYCSKHKREYLVYDGIIMYDKFTSKGLII